MRARRERSGRRSRRREAGERGRGRRKVDVEQGHAGEQKVRERDEGCRETEEG